MEANFDYIERSGASGSFYEVTAHEGYQVSTWVSGMDIADFSASKSLYTASLEAVVAYPENEVQLYLSSQEDYYEEMREWYESEME